MSPQILRGDESTVVGISTPKDCREVQAYEIHCHRLLMASPGESGVKSGVFEVRCSLQTPQTSMPKEAISQVSHVQYSWVQTTTFPFRNVRMRLFYAILLLLAGVIASTKKNLIVDTDLFSDVEYDHPHWTSDHR